MPLSPPPTLCAATANVGIVRWKHVLLLFLRAEAKSEVLTLTARECEKLFAEHASIGMVFVLEPKTQIPGPELVREAVQFFKRISPRLAFRVGLLELGGIGGDLMRAVIRTVLTLSPQADSTMFPDLRSASKALGQRLGSSAQEAQQLFEEGRTLYDKALAVPGRRG